MQRAWSAIKLVQRKASGRRVGLYDRNGQAGFSPVEILLAATIFSMLITALVGTMIFGQVSTADAGNNARATMLAEEGLEAVRNIRDENLANITDGIYGLTQSGGVWTITGAPDTNGIYTRQVTISSVDAKRKTITANVSWPKTAGTGSVSLVTRLTGWGAAVNSWIDAIQAGGYDAPNNGDGIKIATSGNYAYMIRKGSPNFVVFNISNPASPTLVTALDVANSPTNITISGTHAYITTSSNTAELLVMDISNPASPSTNATYNAWGNADGLAVAVSGNYAYLARANNGYYQEFVIINISTPTNPTYVGSYGNNTKMYDVVVSGNYAYVGTNSNWRELIVINITNPASPVLAQTYNLPGSTAVSTLDKHGNTLYLARSSTLYAMNVTNPLAATTLGSVASSGSATINDFAIESNSGTYAFLATDNSNAEFQVVTISDPASMSVVRTVNVASTSILNGIAYNPGLDIVVAASPSNTEELVTFVKD